MTDFSTRLDSLIVCQPPWCDFRNKNGVVLDRFFPSPDLPTATKTPHGRCRKRCLASFLVSSGAPVELPTFFPRRLHRQRLQQLVPNAPSPPDNPLTTKFPPDLVHRDCRARFFFFCTLSFHCRSHALIDAISSFNCFGAIAAIHSFFFPDPFGNASRSHPFLMTTSNHF